MVLKIKKERDRIKTSGLAKKKSKQEYKGKRKDNYKKKVDNKTEVECCLCYNNISNTSDNSIQCGNITHFICGECKFRCNETGNTKCPMCRSHPIKNPIARDVELPVHAAGTKIKKGKGVFTANKMTPKKRRQFVRSGSIYAETFHGNTNRIVRQRSTGTGRTAFPSDSLYVGPWNVYNWNEHNQNILPTVNRNQEWLNDTTVNEQYNGWSIPEDIDLAEILFISSD
jgi:hypothetical protein